MKFNITVEETVAETFFVDAENIHEAEKMAKQKYKKGEICLMPGEVQYRQMKIFTDDNIECSEWMKF